MPLEFSEKLNIKLISYFKNKYGIVLTQEQADLHLQTFAGLFLAFSHGSDDVRGVPRPDPKLSAPFCVQGTKHARGT